MQTGQYVTEGLSESRDRNSDQEQKTLEEVFKGLLNTTNSEVLKKALRNAIEEINTESSLNKLETGKYSGKSSGKSRDALHKERHSGSTSGEPVMQSENQQTISTKQSDEVDSENPSVSQNYKIFVHKFIHFFLYCRYSMIFMLSLRFQGNSIFLHFCIFLYVNF